MKKNVNLHYFINSIPVAAFVLSIILHIYGFNLFINLEKYNILHFFAESAINIVAASIFLLIHYSYPYESKTRYVVSGSLFLSTVVTNIFHTYYSFNGNTFLGVLTSNLVYFTLALTIFLSSILPERPLSKNRWIVNVIPSFFILYNIIFISRNSHINSTTDTIIKDFIGNQGGINVAASLLCLFSFIAIVLRHKRNRQIENIYLENGITFLLFSLAQKLLSSAPNDIYSIASLLFKLASICFIFKTYFVINIKKPYKKLDEARKYAEELNSIKTDFMVNLSHELRTPINIILNAVKLIRLRERNISYLRSIEKNCHRLNKVCQNLILFSEIENDCIQIKKFETDVIFMIDGILEEAEEIADKKKLDINFDFEERDIIITDAQKLKTIILNLISNAIKYAPIGGTVNITLRINENLEFQVLNNGPVITDREKNRIYDKFYKSKDRSLPSTEGLGIGLYISKKYAEILGGQLETVICGGFTGHSLKIPVIKSDRLTSDEYAYDITGFFTDIG